MVHQRERERKREGEREGGSGRAGGRWAEWDRKDTESESGVFY